MSLVVYIATPFIVGTLSIFAIAVILSYPLLTKMLFYRYGFQIFAGGFLLYFLIHIFFGKNKIINILYIISHELSHAIVGILQGNRIKKIRIFDKYGYVSFSKKPDKLTALTPYILPFYNIILAVIFLFVYLIWNRFNYSLFLFLEGVFLSFYLINTLSILLTSQSDFKRFGGRGKSLFTIILSNSVIVYFLVLSFFPDKEMLVILMENIASNYLLIMKSIFRFFYIFLKMLYTLCL